MEMVTSAINEYHKHYEISRIWENNTWLGIPCWKLPMDAFVIQEIIVEQRPDYIIETGTGKGGSAMFYASICELVGHGEVITCDIKPDLDFYKLDKFKKLRKRIKFVYGGSINYLALDKIKKEVNDCENCMVILDSWHSKEHVYKEMLLYSKYVPVGGYMVVEDSHAAGNPVPWEHDDTGPMGAIDQWIGSYGDKWEIDYSREKHLMTFNPKGYLKRIK